MDIKDNLEDIYDNLNKYQFEASSHFSSNTVNHNKEQNNDFAITKK